MEADIPNGSQLVDCGPATRHETLETSIRNIVRKEGVPAFCEHVNDIMLRTFDVEGNSMELTRIILRDLGLTSQVLRIANSALYNRSARPILSVAHAIIMLGWDTVRGLLGVIRYIEHFSNGSPGLRELMLLSVLNAVESREIAVTLGYPHPEEAYICGLFRNLAEVLVACHYPLQYSQVILAMHTEGTPARAACLQYLGFSWDDLGSGVAQSWNMPAKVHSCLRESVKRYEWQADRCLVSITGYACDLTHALYRAGVGIDSFLKRPVIGPEGRDSLLSVQDLQHIIDSALAETGQTFSGLKIPVEKLRLTHQAEEARHILDSTPVFGYEAVKALDQATVTAKRNLDHGHVELSGFISVLLDAVRAAGFDSAVLGLVNEKHTFIRGRLASGPDAEQVLTRFQFAMDHSEGPILAALMRRTDLLIDRARDDRYDRSTLVTTFQPCAFALFPIVTDGKAVGCIYADRKSPSPGLDAIRLSLSRVRDVIASAIRNKAASA